MKKDNQNIKHNFDLLYTISNALLLEDMVSQALEKMIELLNAKAGEFFLFDKQAQIFYLKAQRGLSPEFIGTGIVRWGEGLLGHIADSHNVYWVRDITKETKFDQQLIEQEALENFIGLPLVFNNELLGILTLYNSNTCEFQSADKKKLSEMADIVSVVLNKILLFEEASLRARRFVAISRAITATRSIGTIDEVLQDISRVVVQSFGFDQAWIGVINENKLLSGKVGFGKGMKSEQIEMSIPVDEDEKNPLLFAMQEQCPVIFQFVSDLPEGMVKEWFYKVKAQSCAIIPVLSGDNALGVLCVNYIKDQEFQEDDIKALCSIANQTAIAIENAELYEQIKKSEKQYRTLFDTISTSMVILDKQFRVLLVNPAFEKLSGYGRDSLIGKKLFTDFFDDELNTNSELISHLKSSASHCELAFLDAEKQVKHIFMTSALLEETSEIIVSLIDLTQQRELEKKLYQSQELAAIGELSAGIAHEIRNPLVAITNAVSLLKDETEISEEGKQLLDIVKEESDHLAVIVDDFLKYARPKKPDLKEEDINQLLRELVKKFRDWENNQVRWIESYEPDLQQIPIDRHQIQQVITNLFLNALDAMLNEGDLHIASKLIKHRRKFFIQIQISDSGMGIPNDDIKKIFQPFFSTKEKGTGMGLAICHRIINQHEGDIFVESVENKGTTFTILLPLKQ